MNIGEGFAATFVEEKLNSIINEGHIPTSGQQEKQGKRLSTQSVIQKHPITRQAITAMPDKLCTPSRVIASQLQKNLVV